MTDAPFVIPRAIWLTCPQRRTDADHWREESGRATVCLCWPPEGPESGPPCGAVQPGGPGVCQIRVPGPHTHQALLDDGSSVITWQSNVEGAR